MLPWQQVPNGEGFFVRGNSEGRRPCEGIQGRGPGGRSVKEQARIVMGPMSGVHSSPAACKPQPTRRNPRTCAYYGYWSGVPFAGPEIDMRPRRMVITLPANEKLACIDVAWPISEFFRPSVPTLQETSSRPLTWHHGLPSASARASKRSALWYG